MTIKTMERRQYPRHRLVVPVRLTYKERSLNGQIYDLSRSGFSALVNRFIKEFAVFDVAFYFQKSLVSFQAVVVRSEKLGSKHKVAFYICKINKNNTQILNDIICDIS